MFELGRAENLANGMMGKRLEEYHVSFDGHNLFDVEQKEKNIIRNNNKIWGTIL
jgi:hypothetical protein